MYILLVYEKYAHILGYERSYPELMALYNVKKGNKMK